jgi:FtsH-binding integral membrane protein
MKKILSTLTLISLVAIFMFPALISVSAAPGDPIVTSPDQVTDMIKSLTVWFAEIVLAIAIVFILISAWTFLTAGGNPENVTKARQMLVYALVGIAVAILAWGLPTLVENVFLENK